MSTTTPTDEDLMVGFQNGNAGAFEALYQRYRKPIYSFIARRCKNLDKANDLMQEVFTRAVRGAAAFEHESRFSTWIYAIARNLIVDEARRAGHRTCTSLDQPMGNEGPALIDRLKSPRPEPDRFAAINRLRSDLEKAVAALPEEQQEVFLLREFSGLSFKEIADVVGAKEGTVKSRMRYALLALKNTLADYEADAESLP